MALQFFLYFFTAFGIIQFAVCIWEAFLMSKSYDRAFIVIKPGNGISEIAYLLRKYPFEKYAVLRDSSDTSVNTDGSFEVITPEQLIKKLTL